jgi:hypothetical protein
VTLEDGKLKSGVYKKGGNKLTGHYLSVLKSHFPMLINSC